MVKRRALAPFVALALAALACAPEERPFGTGPVPEPVLFAPGVVSTEAREYGITFGPRGTEAYFTRQERGRQTVPSIYVTRFIEGAWTEPEPASFSTGWEETPFLTPDGQRLIYSSRRELPGVEEGRRNNNLWIVDRTPQGGWSEPRPLPGKVNHNRTDEDEVARSELGPVLLPSGELLYWTTEDEDWGPDLYIAQQVDGAFVGAEPLLINSPGAERNAAVSPDGRYLVFQAVRELDAVGEDDLYVSERTEYGWSEPRLLPEPINSPQSDGYPSFSPDGRYFFFSSDRHLGSGDWSIYYVETRALGLD
ncbi:MAG TPA: hypothetical protein VFQ22_09440 [Longimicrobiales bacterium]|nr:hypothetical protein [Longimicrobiales bacterium]